MTEGSIHICSPKATPSIIRTVCADCKRNSYFIVFSYEYYGPDLTCLRCGRNYNEDGWVRFNYSRGARKKSIEDAKERLRRNLLEVKK